MNVPAALAVQSIPFAWLVLSMRRDNADLFAILYIAGLGLLLSLIVWLGDQLIFDQVMSAVGDFD
ncbi:hypothetical protein FV222_05420 [Methylobacterium sp. WL103]|uniref:hypothetical protein n=1 Tax=unclassified Methylobacterium TaxID=2615210 RepID=UPI0011C7FD1A|nr:MULTISPECIES: hypothetical protein [unclassified Methylobacterium]TXM73390.1 hypothetical protein FV226_09250 [Methylobacterium sp. WL12]TXN06505.1 hypothetical protein FV222_05420 [Methylobacterium sp. WL103]TXN12196.1 hypothetical protein FV219_05250 [Methylobacterium sp. WL122]TXN84002.1 hypothetical protein FV234_04640 [Methylobacterium sp. WL8]